MRRVITALLLAVAIRSAAALPQIPDSLTRPESRAAWLLEHLWDDFDFDDCEAFQDETAVGERLSTYIALMPHADEAARRAAPAALVAKARTLCARTELKRYLEGYLLDRESPVADERLYILFADAMLEADYPEASVTELLRRLAALGAEGSQAPDFPLAVSGRGEMLFSEARGGCLTLLLFHDPGCDECARLEDALRASARVGALVSAGELRVVAVREDNGTDAKKIASRIPPEWTDASTRADVGSLYAVPGMPTLYLIAPDGTILRKDIDWERGSRGVEEALD